MKRPENLKYIFYFFFLFAFIFNSFFFLFPANSRPLLSFSRGDRYYSRLQLWFDLAKKNDWAAADKIEPLLDPVDIKIYKSQNRLEDIKSQIDAISLKQEKTVEDWLELAKLQAKIGDYDQAKQSLKQAQTIDPVRDDLKQFYFQLDR